MDFINEMVNDCIDGESGEFFTTYSHTDFYSE